MITISLLFGALFGASAVILGAFGAHALKKKLTFEQLQSFETGVKYQMYHAITLVVLGFNLSDQSSIDMNIIYCMIIGTILFSFSIYGLVLSSARNRKLTFLGPITPLGGLLLTISWILLLSKFIS